MDGGLQFDERRALANMPDLSKRLEDGNAVRPKLYVHCKPHQQPPFFHRQPEQSVSD
jgi:hypothetical protein